MHSRDGVCVCVCVFYRWASSRILELEQGGYEGLKLWSMGDWLFLCRALLWSDLWELPGPYITFLAAFVDTLSHSCGPEEFIVLVWTDKNNNNNKKKRMRGVGEKELVKGRFSERDGMLTWDTGALLSPAVLLLNLPPVARSWGIWVYSWSFSCPLGLFLFCWELYHRGLWKRLEREWLSSRSAGRMAEKSLQSKVKWHCSLGRKLNVCL